MAIDSAVYIDYFFTQQLDVFTIDDFYKFLKGKGVKITKTQARDLVNSSELVFPLVDDRYITRAGVFSLRWFSFKPSKEEVKKGYVILGHRCMPFVNPEIAPDQIMLETTDGNIIETAAVSFSTNLAMDVFALFGEGYVIPYILNDPANESVPLSSLKYNIPTEVSLTAWPLKAITGNGKKFKYGDRILCKVTDWNMNIVEVSPLYSEPSDTLSAADIEREEWYSVFEKGLLENFDTMGPASSIEEQLAFLYLENQKKLCIKNCGSAEEFLQHTKKIGFAPYGVESRIWKAGQEIPYIGPWNEGVSSDAIFTDMAMVFSVQIIDCYLKNRLYENEKNRQNQTLEELCHTIFPSVLKMSVPEFKMLLLNIEKRNVIITQSYNSFAEYKIAPVRNRVVRLFSQVNNLVCSIGNSGLALENFPQQELVILIQLFSHIIRIIEEMEDEIRVENFPVDDICMSLDGMEETFDDVGEILSKSLEANTYNEMKIVN